MSTLLVAKQPAKPKMGWFFLNADGVNICWAEEDVHDKIHLCGGMREREGSRRQVVAVRLQIWRRKVTDGGQAIDV